MAAVMAKQAKQNHPTVLYKRKIQYSQIVLAILAVVYRGWSTEGKKLIKACSVKTPIHIKERKKKPH